MLTRVRSVGIYVADQEQAKRFWIETMGFELVQDTPMGPPGEGAPRWIEVRAPQDDTLLVLFTTPDQTDRIGTFSNVLFTCSDIVTTCEELRQSGVRIVEEPRVAEWGEWWAVFADPDGNSYGLGQEPASH